MVLHRGQGEVKNKTKMGKQKTNSIFLKIRPKNCLKKLATLWFS